MRTFHERFALTVLLSSFFAFSSNPEKRCHLVTPSLRQSNPDCLIIALVNWMLSMHIFSTKNYVFNYALFTLALKNTAWLWSAWFFSGTSFGLQNLWQRMQRSRSVVRAVAFHQPRYLNRHYCRFVIPDQLTCTTGGSIIDRLSTLPCAVHHGICTISRLIRSPI